MTHAHMTNDEARPRFDAVGTNEDDEKHHSFRQLSWQKHKQFISHSSRFHKDLTLAPRKGEFL